MMRLGIILVEEQWEQHSRGGYEVYVIKMSGGISDWMDMGVKEKRRSGCVTGVEPG